MMRARVLEIIAAQPGIRVRELKRLFPDVHVKALYQVLHQLRQSREIEPCGYTRYRVAERRPSSVGGQFIPPGQVIPLSRLMAGR